jgi:hypothetical protein
MTRFIAKNSMVTIARNRIAGVLLISLCSMLSANADTYTWTDSKGAVNFTDDPGVIPRQYRVKAKKGEDITIRNPKIQLELKEQEERVRRDKISRPRVVPTPDYAPPQPSPTAVPPKTVSEESPPGRTKSQRIRENIERREAEEKAQQAVEGEKY